MKSQYITWVVVAVVAYLVWDYYSNNSSTGASSGTGIG